MGLNYVNSEYKLSDTAQSMKMSATSLTYTVNADALFNFYNNEQTSYGAFVGIGLGGASNTLDAVDLNLNDESVSGFYADAKVGLRASSGHNSVDLFAVIPFTKNSTKFNNVDITFQQNYRIMLAYNYTF